MRRIVFLIVTLCIFLSCQNTSSSSGNSDFEGFWSSNGVVLHFSAASLIWIETGKENHTYTYSAGNGSITITDKDGKTISGTYSMESKFQILKINFSGMDQLTLSKISKDI